jgi:hypothetical protein
MGQLGLTYEFNGAKFVPYVAWELNESAWLDSIVETIVLTQSGRDAEEDKAMLDHLVNQFVGKKYYYWFSFAAV